MADIWSMSAGRPEPVGVAALSTALGLPSLGGGGDDVIYLSLHRARMAAS
jgi:hypothetical protein